MAQEVQVDLSRYPDGTTVPSGQVISDEWRQLGILFSARRSSEAVGVQGSVAPVVPGSGSECNRYYFFDPDIYGAVGIFQFVEPGTTTPMDISHFEMVAEWNSGELISVVGFDQSGAVTAEQTFYAPSCSGFCDGLIQLSGQFQMVEVRTVGNPGIGFSNCGLSGGYGLRFAFVDADGDGEPDTTDVCPGHDDAADADADGTPDGCDACPADYHNDSDGDGACDSADPCPMDTANDSDGDGLCADADECPSDAENDADADGVCGGFDVCPYDAANDADGDGVCGNLDTCSGGDDAVDADGDGTADACDLCPQDAANDADGDGQCADVDPCPIDAHDDADGDGLCADRDLCPNDPVNDADADAICGDVDPCPADVANDADGDGLCESTDNCPTVENENQSDVDADGVGDACEPDDDGDGVIDDADNCPLLANPDQLDVDEDGAGDACDADADGDAVSDANDVCLGTPSGSPVLANGCSVAQQCKCSAAWKNHGAYVSCVVKATDALLASRAITQSQNDAIISAAADSTCGSPK